MITRTLLPVLVLVLAFAGCTHLGPQTVTRDRFDYNTAISDSWKEQTLLNIVKIRYADMPLFVEVASIVSGYTLEGSVNINGILSSKDWKARLNAIVFIPATEPMRLDSARSSE